MLPREWPIIEEVIQDVYDQIVLMYVDQHTFAGVWQPYMLGETLSDRPVNAVQDSSLLGGSVVPARQFDVGNAAKIMAEGSSAKPPINVSCPSNFDDEMPVVGLQEGGVDIVDVHGKVKVIGLESAHLRTL